EVKRQIGGKIEGDEPHAPAILEGIRTALKSTIEVAMDLVLPFPALIKQGELEESPNIGAVASQGNEDGDVGGAILRVLAVGIEIDSPLVTADGESVAGDVFPDPDSFRQRVPLDCEAVRSVYEKMQQELLPPPKKPRLGEEAQEIIPATDPFLRCANLVLPWLNLQELAAVSQTCKALSLISQSLTSRRSLDAARSLENLPIPFRNAVDSKRYACFVYTLYQVPASSPPPRQWWGSASDECNSDGAGGDNPASRTRSVSDSIPHSKSESASSRLSLDSVSERGRFGVSLVDESGEGVHGCECERCEEGCCRCLALAGMEEIANECGSGCGCGLDCPNRVTQKGISVRLKIVRDEKKGWCLYADQLIEKGRFICEYAGELLTTDEARRRQNLYDKLRSTRSFSSALLVIREHLPSGQACLRMNIDATRIGNVARFINHSCDGGNLSTVLLRSSGALIPRLCFFAARDIVADEELSFSYGDVRVTAGENGDSKLNCSCGSSCCFGTLPCENT
ncbi:unnamed protein product, partial [Thlaspi arvense]